MFILTLSVILLVVIDQITKLLTLSHIKPVGTMEIVKNILSFTYVENRGAAFGILQDARWVFIAVTVVIIALFIAYTLKKKPESKLYYVAASLITSGGIGNLIDRMFRGFVVDMIEVKFIDYPVFNFADCCVVVGSILLCLFILIIDTKTEKKDGDN